METLSFAETAWGVALFLSFGVVFFGIFLLLYICFKEFWESIKLGKEMDKGPTMGDVISDIFDQQKQQATMLEKMEKEIAELKAQLAERKVTS